MAKKEIPKNLRRYGWIEQAAWFGKSSSLDEIMPCYQLVLPKNAPSETWIENCWPGKVKSKRDAFIIGPLSEEKAKELLTAYRIFLMTKFGAIKDQLKI